MVFKVGREETLKEKRHSCTEGPGVNLTELCRPALRFHRADPCTASKGLRGPSKKEQHLSQEGSGPPAASAWTRPVVFPGLTRLPVGSTCGYHWAMATSVLDVLKQP